MPNVSASLTVWASEWLAGRAAPDDVVDALTRWAPMHLVAAGDMVSAGTAGLAYPDPVDVGAVGLLSIIRAARPQPGGDPIALVMPVPGDTSGIPAGAPFATLALDAGEAVIVPAAGAGAPVALVPTVEGPDVLRWTVFAVEGPTLTPWANVTGLAEAEYLLREATRGAADALAQLNTAPSSTGMSAREAVVEPLADLSLHRLPSSIPPRAARVFDTANHIDAIITVAETYSAPTPLSAAGIAARDDALRPLRSAVRHARLAATRECTRAGG